MTSEEFAPLNKRCNIVQCDRQLFIEQLFIELVFDDYQGKIFQYKIYVV